MSLREYSDGYYEMEMNIQKYKEGPVIQRQLYDFISREIYSMTDSPIMMRIGFDGTGHFPVRYENAMPTDTLAIPEYLLKEIDFDEDTYTKSIFILKPQYSHLMSTGFKRNSGDGSW